MKRIRKVDILREKFLLERPYHLSFATLRHFDSIQVKISLEDGHSKLAEVVPLPGYNEETPDTVLKFIESHISGLKGLTLEEARSLMEPYIDENPFAVSPLLTSIDLFSAEFPFVNTSEVKFVIPTSITKSEHLKKCYRLACEEKRAIKIKLSGNIIDDINGLSSLKDVMLSSSGYSTDIRFDANQAYDLKDALMFYQAIEQTFNEKQLDQIEYIEQPLNITNWEGSGVLVNKYKKIRTMLDESIITKDDVERAYKLGVRIIKLKLFKQGGIRESLKLARYAQSKGMSTVYGNGVASFISNRIEFGLSIQYPQLFYKDSEANGFLKIKK